MAAASRSLATALLAARFASGLLCLSYATKRDTTLLGSSAFSATVPCCRNSEPNKAQVQFYPIGHLPTGEMHRCELIRLS